MNSKNFEQLDYFRIRQKVSSYALSQEGKNAILEILPYTDVSIIEEKKHLAENWNYFFSLGYPNCFHPWNEASHVIPILKVEGSCLEKDSVYALGQFCLSVENVQKTFLSIEQNNSSQCEKLSFLINKIKTLPQLSQCQNLVFSVLEQNGEVKDLPQIKAIKASIRKKQTEIGNIIKNYTTNSEYQDMLQSTIPVLRSNRQMIALKANFKGRIKGIVHEVSQTGQTIYVEPDEVVQCSNELVQEEFRLTRELRRIFTELTASISKFVVEIEQALSVMIQLDIAYASATWANEERCIYAQNCDETENLTLLGARHPVLGKNAVPIDVVFNPNCKVLIITGANTGGKTVTLKTIALFALLNQSGFPLPANEGTRLPIFTSVLADIGDEQSLDQSLSTFSGHMKNIAQMISCADDKSLILLDELGSGTDPQEGGAIAMSVLDTLIQKNSFVILTTHHGILKNYGYTHPQCQNASVEFDSNTLSPTYKIVMGVPGESHALEIARRSGIPSEIIDKACSYIDTKQADVSFLIKGLTEKYKELSDLEKEFKDKEKIINEKWRKVDLKELKIKQHELELREIGYKQSKDFVDSSRKMLENLVRELKEGDITREKTLKVKETIAMLTQSVEKEDESLQSQKDSLISNEVENENNQIEYNVGDEVYIGKHKTEGVLISKQKKDTWLVQSGSVKLPVKVSELYPRKQRKVSVSIEIVQDKAEPLSHDSRVTFGQVTSEKPVFELRLLGMRYEQAIKALEKQLDLCAINNFKQFSVIHGKGNGILQKGVWDYLKNYPQVDSFVFAKPEDGGSGKTYVTLK